MTAALTDMVDSSVTHDDTHASDQAARKVLNRVFSQVSEMTPLVEPLAQALVSRHGYDVAEESDGPHGNVLGHPLLELPVWIDEATGSRLDAGTLDDILESSVWGYLSVRAEDDYFDGHWGDPHGAMALSGVCRSRHQSLLALHIPDERFWSRYREVWDGYADSMLLERRLHAPDAAYGPEDFDRVLRRSQPLEIPANAVLAIKNRWEHAAAMTALVEHLVKATQLFDDFVDAPEDLASGNYTWMVRRLGGKDGPGALMKGMVTRCDEVFDDASRELDSAAVIASDLGIELLAGWVETRKAEMTRASQRMYQALLESLA